jgi:hypothetical protein
VPAKAARENWTADYADIADQNQEQLFFYPCDPRNPRFCFKEGSLLQESQIAHFSPSPINFATMANCNQIKNILLAIEFVDNSIIAGA